MPATNSRQAKPALPIAFIDSSAKGLCNANIVLQNAMRKLEPEVKNLFLLRCDELPFVLGDEESIETVFLELIQMIAEKNDTATKMYLHIKTAIDDTEAIQAFKQNGFSRYFIQFHTNMTPCEEWIKTSEQKISDLNTLLAPFAGNLALNPLKNSGCILSVALPGKL
ncbi:MAG: hypothetical protein JWR72_1155 [Flavisolibacter sp.]|jgi:hypothetical protein|nr:hypothetical protein [Flavisolibacter sp.]